MKHDSVFILLLLLSKCILLEAQEVDTKKQKENLPFTLKKGVELVYDVKQQNKKYQFIVTFTEVSSQRVSFDWKMTEPINFTGKVTMNENALKNAEKLFNYFTNQSNEFLTDQTSVLIAEKPYRNMLKNKKLELDFGNRKVVLEPSVFGSFPKIVMVNNDFSFIPAELSHSYYAVNPNYTISFARIGDFNLILTMDIEFSINLASVNFK